MAKAWGRCRGYWGQNIFSRMSNLTRLPGQLVEVTEVRLQSVFWGLFVRGRRPHLNGDRHFCSLIILLRSWSWVVMFILLRPQPHLRPSLDRKIIDRFITSRAKITLLKLWNRCMKFVRINWEKDVHVIFFQFDHLPFTVKILENSKDNFEGDFSLFSDESIQSELALCWQIICCWGFALASINKSASLRAWNGLRGSLYILTKSSESGVFFWE